MQGYFGNTFGNMLKVVIKERILNSSTKWVLDVEHEDMHKVIGATKLKVHMFHDCNVKEILFRTLLNAEAFV
jgi:hypothetical protein